MQISPKLFIISSYKLTTGVFGMKFRYDSMHSLEDPGSI